MFQPVFRRAGLASVAVSALALGGTAVSASAAAASMTLSNSIGPSGGGNTIVGTAAGGLPTFPAGTSPVVQFQYAGTGSTTCTLQARTETQIASSGSATTAGVLTADPATVKRINTTKIAFRVPSGAHPGGNSSVNSTGLALLAGQISSKWFVCVYDTDSTTTSTLLASSAYTLAARPTITSILPTSSPAAGGQTITVNGTGFSAITPVSGSIGGAALTNVRIATNGNSFTATTGPHAADSGLALTVNAPGGQVSSLDPDNNGQPQDNDGSTNDAPIPFAYTSGITISPNTAPAGALVNIDVAGPGFSHLTFVDNDTPTSNNAHIFLVRDAYVPNSNRGVAECGDAAVISDTELACTLDLSSDQLSPSDSAPLAGTPIVEGAYILTVVADGSTSAGSDANPTIVCSGATFTVAPY